MNEVKAILIILILSLSISLFAQGSGSAIDYSSDDTFTGFCPVDFGLESEISVTAWVKWSIDPSTGQKWANIFSNNANVGLDNGQFWLQHSENNTYFEFAVKGTNRNWVFSDTQPEKDVWYHLAGVYDSSLTEERVKIYVNGVKDGANNNVSGDIAAFQESYFCKAGRWSCTCADRAFTGIIDEITIWKKALSQAEIRDMMCKKLTGNEDSLIGYWRFDEASGDSTIDLSGNDHHGYIFNENGEASSGGNTTLTDDTKSWSADEWQDHVIGLTNGTGAGQKRYIQSNTSTQITVKTAWDTNPDNTTAYVISTSDEWLTSGAAIGDASTYDYSSPSSLTLNSSEGDGVTVSSISGSPDGIQIYRVDAEPNVTTPPGNLVKLSPEHYFGVFMTGGTDTSFTLTYDYEGHPGITDESSLDLAIRTNNATTSWSEANATLSAGDNTLELTNQTRNEYILATESGDNTLPVVLSTFTAQYMQNRPLLYWETQSENDNFGWNIYRNKEYDYATSSQVNSELIPGNGTTSDPNYYTFSDNCDALINGTTYYYWLESLDLSGQSNVYNKVVSVTIPETGEDPGFSIPQNYNLTTAPNPMYDNTCFKFTLDQDAYVDIIIYNIKGKLVKELPTVLVGKDETHIVQWNGKDAENNNLKSGIYFYKFKANGKTMAANKLIIMK